MKSARCKERLVRDISNLGSPKLRPKRGASASSMEMETHAAGRIARSTGRKDRHSKVCTARGPRDRRVRLSPNTAIQFYDVQDRLGYDRPSKAIDWLMKEAKAAIDALDGSSSYGRSLNDATLLMDPSHDHNPLEKGLEFDALEESEEYLNGISIGNCSSFSVEDGILAPPSSTQILAYPNGDLCSRNKAQPHGLSLSFHSCQSCSFFFSDGQEQGLIPDSTPTHCETIPEVARFQKLLCWNSNSCNIEDSREALIDSLPLHYYTSHNYDEIENQLHFQREPLQSSFCPTVRDPLLNQFSTLNHAGGIRFPGDDGFSGLSSSSAARIQGPEAQNPPSSKPTSAATSLLHYRD